MNSNKNRRPALIGAAFGIVAVGLLTGVGIASAADSKSQPSSQVVLTPVTDELKLDEDVKLTEIPESEAPDAIAKHYGISRSEAAKLFAQAKKDAAAARSRADQTGK
jgi:hypothetical protein